MVQEYNFSTFGVLVVDSSFFMRSITTKICRGFGFKVVREAANAFDALQNLKSPDIDVMILDWGLEDMSVPELLRLIRNASDLRDPNIPVIVTCSGATRRSVMDSRDSGGTEFMTKPFSAAEILKRLVYCIERPRMFVQCRAHTGPDRRRREADVEDDRRKPPE